jgi:oxygen-dependent protoporphyrinogen oxidase
VSAHVVVVGGGITGLAAAHALAQDPRARALNLSWTLVEREARLGGKLRTEHVHGCLVEAGPDSFLAAKPAAADLCRALGLGDRLIGTLPGRAVYMAHRARLHPLPDGLAMGVPGRALPVLRTALLSPAEKLRLGLDLVLPRGQINGDESVGALIRRRLGRAAVDRLAGPLLAGIYAGDADQLSARATFPHLLEWEASHRSLIVAALAQRRRAGSQRTGASPLFLSLVGGVEELVRALAASLGNDHILPGRTATRITRRADAGRSPYVVKLDDGRRLDADAVLLATPAFAAADLLDPLAPAAAAELRKIPYASTAAVTLGYRRSAVLSALDGHGFVVAHGEPLQITACTWTSSKWPHRAPPEIALLRCYLGAAGRDAIVDEEDDHLIRTVRADLRATMRLDAEPVFSVVSRWRRAMPQYLPGHLDRLAAIAAAMRALPRVALAGAGYRGIGIPDCIRQGREAAGQLVDALAASHPPV